MPLLSSGRWRVVLVESQVPQLRAFDQSIVLDKAAAEFVEFPGLVPGNMVTNFKRWKYAGTRWRDEAENDSIATLLSKKLPSPLLIMGALNADHFSELLATNDVWPCVAVVLNSSMAELFEQRASAQLRLNSAFIAPVGSEKIDRHWLLSFYTSLANGNTVEQAHADACVARERYDIGLLDAAPARVPTQGHGACAVHSGDAWVVVLRKGVAECPCKLPPLLATLDRTDDERYAMVHDYLEAARVGERAFALFDTLGDQQDVPVIGKLLDRLKSYRSRLRIGLRVQSALADEQPATERLSQVIKRFL